MTGVSLRAGPAPSSTGLQEGKQKPSPQEHSPPASQTEWQGEHEPCWPALVAAGTSGEPLAQMFPTKTAALAPGRAAACPPPYCRGLQSCHLLQLPAIGQDSWASAPGCLVWAAAAGRGLKAAPRPDGCLAGCIQGGSARTTATPPVILVPETLLGQIGDLRAGPCSGQLQSAVLRLPGTVPPWDVAGQEDLTQTL